MFGDLSNYEKTWMVSFLLIIFTITLYSGLMSTDYGSLESVMLNLLISPISAITGIICVLLVAKGKIANYAWGIVNVITYSYISFSSGYYGDMVLNLFWFLPTQFVGFFYWSKMLKKGSKTDVTMRKLNVKQIAIILLVGSIFTLLFGSLLNYVDYWLFDLLKINSPIYQYIFQITGLHIGGILDGSTEILQIIATILMILSYREQWLFWILTNIISINLWVMVFIADPLSIGYVAPIIIMWVAYLINSFYGFYEWDKGAVVA